jgi:hypothetical protein
VPVQSTSNKPRCIPIFFTAFVILPKARASEENYEKSESNISLKPNPANPSGTQRIFQQSNPPSGVGSVFILNFCIKVSARALYQGF